MFPHFTYNFAVVLYFVNKLSGKKGEPETKILLFKQTQNVYDMMCSLILYYSYISSFQYKHVVVIMMVLSVLDTYF